MKILLAACNAKYIHTNLAIRNLRDYLNTHKISDSEVRLMEFSINNVKDTVIRDIFLEKPDVLGFSCYIWNINYVCEIAATLKQLLPNTVFVAGGPEVSFECEQFLKENPCFDYVVHGEGEIGFTNLISALQSKDFSSPLEGVCYLDDNGTFVNFPVLSFCNLNELPFPYTQEDFNSLKNKILYYETSRGCPYLCQYCLSGLKETVRTRDLHLVKQDLLIFLGKKVKQVKFVDRTFNFDPKRAGEIWQFLIENDNGVTNFHFEIGASLVDCETVTRLKQARPGLFQFEIGVQTTNETTCKYIKRPAEFEKIKQVVQDIKALGNIHQHLDLIAGLPAEDYLSFRNSFNDVYNLQPEQLQLGFLKVLKGSGLYKDQEKYHLTYDQIPPYEILHTDVLPYSDILRLKVIEDCVERYYNSGRFQNTLQLLFTAFSTPFDMFESLSQFFETRGFGQNLSKEANAKVLYDFGTSLNIDNNKLGWLLRYDLLSFEKQTKQLPWLPQTLFQTYKEPIYLFLEDKSNWEHLLPMFSDLSNRQIGKHVHIEVFPFDITNSEYKEEYTPILFAYQNNALTQPIIQKIRLNAK